VPLGSSIADPSKVAELFDEIKALNDRIKALEERIKTLEGKPAGEAGGAVP
jgi:ubiquinone biosynthesis protein UbiJ